MRPVLLLAALASLASSTLAFVVLGGSAANNHTDLGYDPLLKHFDCGTDSSAATDHFLSTIHSLHRDALTRGTPAGALTHKPSPAARDAPITVDLYMHIVTKATDANTVTPGMASAQFNTLNQAYAPYGVQFVLRNTSTTINDAWAVGATDADDTAMKTALRQGTYAALNLYFQSDAANGVLGRCSLPANIGSSGAKPAAYVKDGCNIAAQTMPGGTIYGYNQGKTAVHETGHWLGLLHTFEGYSCAGNGDFVADTPQESQSTTGCPTSPWKNTCGTTRAGVDPIHNYMDYSTDACYTRFTPMQVQRIRTLWPLYRKGK